MEKPESKFEVGDVVRVSLESSCWSGTEGTITEGKDDEFGFTLDTAGPGWPATCITLVRRAEPKAEWVPRVGDRVRLRPVSPTSPMYWGQLGLVTGDPVPSYHQNSIPVRFHGDLHLSFVSKRQLEPAPPENESAAGETTVRGMDPAFGAPADVVAMCERVNKTNAPDPYEEHRQKLVQRLTRNGFQPHPSKKHGAALDHYVALSMDKEDNTPDKWAGDKQSPRQRLIAALAKDLDQGAERRARLHPAEGRSDRVYLVNRRER